MRTKIIEVTQNREVGPNWGKMLVGEFDDEWRKRSALDQSPLLRSRGWGPQHRLVVDLETGEGAVFLMGGLAHADLDKHAIHVCVLYEAFLTWLYANPMPLAELPDLIELPDVPFAMAGYRRAGPAHKGT